MEHDPDQQLRLAREGDERAFAQLTGPYRHELQLHCYRIVGSLQDAEDVLQETLLAAWRGLSAFERRSSLRSWLYTIATNRSLNALRDAGRRPQSTAVPSGHRSAENFSEISWLQPYPDALLDGIPDAAPGPEARYEAKETVALAFVSGLAHLPPLQRAVLVLRDVLGYRAVEVASMLDRSPAAVNSALVRARDALDARGLGPGARERLAVPAGAAAELIERFTEAFESDDIEGVIATLTEDAVVSMPPEPLWHQGVAEVEAFLRARAARRPGHWRLLATTANRQPAVAFYLRGPDGGLVRSGLMVIGLRQVPGDGPRVESITRFHDRGLLDRWDLPERLAAHPG